MESIAKSSLRLILYLYIFLSKFIKSIFFEQLTTTLILLFSKKYLSCEIRIFPK